MWPIFSSIRNRLVRKVPSVPAAMKIGPARMVPSGDVAFVTVRSTQSQPIESDITALGQVKNELVASMEKRRELMGL